MNGWKVNRRAVLGAGLAALTVNGGPLRAAGSPKLAPASPPRARVEPVTDDYFGTSITDPYRWMENPKDRDWLPYMRGQNVHARSLLGAIPGRDALARRISALTGDAAATRKVAAAGDFLFFEQRPAGSNNFKLFLRHRGDAPQILIDPTTMGSANAHVSLDWWQPSEDGRYLAYGLSESGSEASVLHVMEVAGGRVMAERIPMTDWGLISWLPDASGFFYHRLNGRRGDSSLYQNSEMRLHRLGQEVTSDRVVLKAGSDPRIPISAVQAPIVLSVPGSQTVIALVSDIRREKAVYAAPLTSVLAGTAEWRKIADFDDLVTGLTLVGDDLYLLSNKDRPRGRVLMTSASKPDLATAREVVPQGNTVIEDITAASDGIILTIMDGGVQRLNRIARGGAVAPVALPFEGSVDGVYASPDRPGAYVALTGWLHATGIYELTRDGKVRNTGINPAPTIDVSPYDTRRAFATARDGTRIPYTMIYRRGLKLDGTNPTLIAAYGAYQSSSTPGFLPRVFPFLDAGAVFAVANVRGGGEYGREWHQAGMKATKANTWRDLIDVAETLVRNRITTPEKLAIIGGSAGGITVGRAMAERPDLFAAVVNMVGWVNPIRYSAEQNVADIDEWGPIKDAESFRVMYAMDAYHAVRKGVRYPAVLATTGITDPRVAPWHMAKYAARLQAATGSGKPILLRVDFDAGHGIGSTRNQTDALFADAYAFVLWQTGARGFQRK